MQQRRTASDEGVTLIEVLVALLVFAVLSTGIIAGTTTVIRMTADNRARITAANLASQELDTVRSISDTYSVDSVPARDIPVDGRTYHLTRTVAWVSAAGGTITCNSATNLFLLQVNVTVTWDGMLSTNPGVQDDTVLAPADGSTNSTLGAIAVFVKTSTGDPVQGVTVTVSVPAGFTGEPPSAQPRPTTTDGCTYANGVKPGSYRIKVSKAGYRDQSGNASPFKDVSVSAGGTTSAEFVLDPAAVVNTNFVFGPQSVNVSPAIPVALPLNFTVNGATTTVSGVVSRLVPTAAPYSVAAGPARCAAVDPQAWLAADVNGVQLLGGVTPVVNAAVGSTQPVNVPLGVVLVKAPDGAALTATPATPVGDGNPGCAATGSRLTWTVHGDGTWVALALPYGSWTVSADGVPLAADALQVLTNTALPGVSSDGTVTLDPRSAR